MGARKQGHGEEKMLDPEFDECVYKDANDFIQSDAVLQQLSATKAMSIHSDLHH